jgi:hypothetical protein
MAAGESLMAQIRGLFNWKDKLYAARGATLYQVPKEGSAVTIGTLNSSAGVVTFDENLTQLQVCDGTYLYIWDGMTLQEAPNFPPGRRFAVVNERTVAIQRNSQRYGWTDPGNALVQSSLDFKSAESLPDVLVSMVAVNSDLWLAGAIGTEVHTNTGTSAVFERYDGATLEFGSAAPYAMQKCAGRPMWLATSGRRGQAVVVMAGAGQGVAVVSDRAVEERLRGRSLYTAEAFTFTFLKDEFYALQVPGLDATQVFNATTRQWTEIAELRNGRFTRWRARCHAFAYGRNYFGDREGRLYYADHDAHSLAGDPLVRTRICPAMGQDQGRMAHYPKAQLVCERATGGVAMLRWKDDPQDGWSGWQRVSVGARGKYRTAVEFNQLGAADGLNGRVFELRMTDDAPFNPVTMDFGVR